MATKKPPSQFAATMIGTNVDNSKAQLVKQQFREEAREISQHLQGVHHARKLPFMQVDYSDTVNKLSKMQSSVPVAVVQKPPETIQKPHSHNRPAVAQTEQQFANSMREAINQERFINERKRLYNRENGRVAVVNQILKGGGPPVKDHIYPQNAKHEQILAMTGSLKAPSAHIVPPEVQRNKKWLGDGIGWES